MYSGVVAREYEAGDEEKIVDLLSKGFSNWQTRSNKVEYWKCKYPSGKSKNYVAEIDGKIVGVVSYIQCQVKIGEQTRKATFGDDLCTDPEYRGRGVTKTIDQARRQWDKSIDLDLSYVITTNPIVVGSGTREDAKELPYKINHLILINDVNSYLRERNLKTALLGSSLSLMKSIQHLGTQNSRDEYDFAIKETPIDNWINTFWEKARTQYNFVVEKTYEHLAWRYQPALGDYKIKQATRDGEVLGFAVLENRRDDDHLEGYITDLVTLPGRVDVATALIDESLNYFENESANSVHYRNVKGSPHQELLKNMGFIEPPRAMDMHMLIYYQKPGLHMPVAESKPEQLYFTYGDYL